MHTLQVAEIVLLKKIGHQRNPDHVYNYIFRQLLITKAWSICFNGVITHFGILWYLVNLVPGIFFAYLAICQTSMESHVDACINWFCINGYYVNDPNQIKSFCDKFNLLFFFSGVGILSIPYALAQGGWVSLSLLLLVAVICYYTGLLLQKCMDSNSLIKTYPDIGQLAFGQKGRIIVSITMYLELYFAAINFLILEGDNLEKLFPKVGFNFAGMKIGGKQGFVMITSLIVLPTTWLQSLSMLAYMSVGGVLASLVLMVSVLWAGLFNGVGFRQKGIVLNWEGIPTAVSLYAFCFSGHSVFPTIYNSMQNPSKFSKVSQIYSSQFLVQVVNLWLWISLIFFSNEGYH